MITFTRGNLFDSDCEAFVNTVNTFGVMGRGIALEFKKRFPDNYTHYRLACKRSEVKIGKMFVTYTNALDNPIYIINFPTKEYYWNPSKLEWIQKGLKSLVQIVREYNINSIAIPALGCGNGGLKWVEVRKEIEGILAPLNNIDILVFEDLHNEP